MISTGINVAEFLCFFSISNTATVDEITNSVLRVKTVKNYQYGDYNCKASNKVGHTEARINLFGKYVVVSEDQPFVCLGSSVNAVLLTPLLLFPIFL